MSMFPKLGGSHTHYRGPRPGPPASSWVAPNYPLDPATPDFPTSPTEVRLLPASPTDGPPSPTWSPGGGGGRLPQLPRPLRPPWPGTVSPPHRLLSGDESPEASHSAVTIADVEEEPKETHRDEEECEESYTRQRARAMGTEDLYDVFCARHPDGTAPLTEVPGLLAEVGLDVSQDEVDAAVLKVCPECAAVGCVTVSQCQDVLLHLRMERQNTGFQQQELGKAGRFTQWMATLSDEGATNLLLVVVVTFCCISAFLAAAVAIVLNLQDGHRTMQIQMEEDLAIVQDNLELFGQTTFWADETMQMEMLITTLSSVFTGVAYYLQLDQVGARLYATLSATVAVLNAWWAHDPQQSFADAAALLALLAEAALEDLGLGGAAGVLDEANRELAPGFEALLAHWRPNATPPTVDYLTAWRYAAQCANRTCGPGAAAAPDPMAAALAGAAFAQRTRDYRNATVYAGYSGTTGLGVELKLDAATLDMVRLNATRAALDAWNAAAVSSTAEFVLAHMPSPGRIVLGSVLKDCNASCVKRAVAAGSPLARAVAGETGLVEFVNCRGVPAVAVFAPLATATLRVGLVLQMAKSELVASAVADIAAVLDLLNEQQTEEFELVTFQRLPGNNLSFTHPTAFKHADECPAAGCPVAAVLQRAARNCSAAVAIGVTPDYRGRPSLMGRSCLPELGAVVSLKIDMADLEAEALGNLVMAVNDRIDRDPDTSAEYLMAVPVPGVTAAEVDGYDDFYLATKIKYPESCLNPNCTWNRLSALLALQDRREVRECPDYRNIPVMSAPARSSALSHGLGLALELDTAEFMQPILDIATLIAAFTAGMVGGCTVLLVVVTKLVLRSMIHAKEEGKRAVEVEKDRFSKLVASMYPTYVLPRLLEGEKQLVCEIQGAAVFFSDIHEFTSASNTMNSHQLLQLMGYLYGVIDDVADRFGVYKVKTIGDAYLAVCGLPGSQSENPGLDLLRFASCVAQVFSTQYLHPAEGDVLVLMNQAMAWNGNPAARKKRASFRPMRLESIAVSPGSQPPHPTRHPTGLLSPRQHITPESSRGNALSARTGGSVPSLHLPPPSARKRSVSPASPRGGRRGKLKVVDDADSAAPSLPGALDPHKGSVASTASTDLSHLNEAKVQCVMSYGLAMGRLVAGVLAGRCPMFDIWGGTVNLASRMQSTGAPGRIQVSEQLHKKVIAVSGQPFTFEAPKSTYCKGFGNINAYMVRATTEGLPPDLEVQLRLEPHFGPFSFDYLLTTPAKREGPTPWSTKHRTSAARPAEEADGQVEVLDA